MNIKKVINLETCINIWLNQKNNYFEAQNNPSTYVIYLFLKMGKRQRVKNNITIYILSDLFLNT